MAKADATKIQKSLKIFQRITAKHPDPKQARPRVIKELQAKLGMTPGGASTYYANAKNGKWAIEVKPVAVKAVKPVAKVAKPAVKAVAKPTKPVKAKAASTVVPASKQAKVKPAVVAQTAQA